MEVYLIQNKGRIAISKESSSRMKEYIQDSREKLEGGGVLLGRFIIDSKDIIVDHVTIPMIGDKRSRTSFFRGDSQHQKIVNNWWAKSAGTCNYLGEWHTHPENYPTPSETDLQGWKEKLKTDKFSSRYLYFIIVGIKELCIWEGDRRKLKFKKLNSTNEK